MLYYLLKLICKYKNNGAVQELYEHTSYKRVIVIVYWSEYPEEVIHYFN